MKLQQRVPARLRGYLRRQPAGGDRREQPWPEAIRASKGSNRQTCNICGWHGEAFASPFHSEGALCPCCGSIARDRFLYWCWTHRAPYQPEADVLETSPRLDHRYRDHMAKIVKYVSSDYDESAHKGVIKLDLQDANLPDASVDIVLTPHVLEHVPDTGRALSEVFRILRPGGSMFLQIPMPQGVTAPPAQPEYHGDNTLVYWRFGWDIRELLEKAGFAVQALVTEDLRSRVERGDLDTGYGGDDCDEVDLLSHVTAAELVPVADAGEAQRYGFLPDFMFITWEAHKPA